MNKWEIYFCNLNPTTGSEQRGERPVLVVSNDAVNHHLPISTVLPLSSLSAQDKLYPTEVMLPSALTGLPKDSVAMVQQIRTVSHQRLERKTGDLSDPLLREQINDALREYFEI